MKFLLKLNTDKGDEMITKEEAEKFYNEIEEVCRKHNISISHEDGHGGFLLETYDDFYMRWLRDTNLEDENGKPISGEHFKFMMEYEKGEE